VDFTRHFFGSEVCGGCRRGREEQIRLGIDGGSIFFLGPREARIMSPEAGFDVSDRHTSSEPRKRRPERARRVALHHEEIEAKAKRSHERYSDGANVAVGIFFTGTSQPIGLQTPESESARIEVRVLAGQNEAGREAPLKEGDGDRSEFDSFRPGADDQPDLRVSQPSP
jgi:hypothetical protein